MACKTTPNPLNHINGATLPAFQMLNLKVLSSKEAGHWCRSRARGGTQTAAGESAARHTHTHTHTHAVCAGERTGSRGRWTCANCRSVPARDSHQEGICISVAFRSILFRTPAELGGWPGVPWGSGREAILTAGPPLSPHLMKTQRLDCFPGTLLPSPALLCSRVCGGSY